MKRAVYFGHLLILLTDRILSPSTDFRRPKHGQNCPAANFRPKGVCSPIYTGLFTFYGPSQYLSSFPSNGPKSKKIPVFFTDFLVRPQKKVSGSCTLNFDATDLQHSQFEPLQPKVFRGTLKVDLVGIQHPPKSAHPKNCPLFSVFFGFCLTYSESY